MMSTWGQNFFIVLSAIILFLYGLEHFSQEVQRVGMAKLKSGLEKLASNRFMGFILGAASTAALQSSSALSAITIALVNSKILSFKASLAILFGSNLGTTLTAQIVALKLTGIGPVFIVLGTLVSLLKFKIHIVGRTLFYFGFIFFSLDLISASLAPLQNSPEVLRFLAKASTPVLGVLMGALVTMALQSSSVSTGLVILLVQAQTLPVEAAIPLVLGANIGTTATGLIAALKMDRTAKRTALANTIFNFTGVLLIFPFIGILTTYLGEIDSRPSQLVANTHLFFNLAVSIFFLAMLNPFERLMIKIMPIKN
jgi:phosphate:Na+ symporter